MAERRMFSKRIVRSAKFLKMPVSSRELYWQLGIEADDDGIVESFNVMRMTGATEDDLRVLVSKGFVQVLNEDLVAYITDWNENNKLRADRKVDSIYKHLLLQINPDVQLLQAKPRADTKKLTGQPTDNQWTSNGLHSIGKDSVVQDSIGEVSIKELEIEFEELWKLYPKKKEKPKALKSYIKARKEGTTKEEVKQGIDNYNKEIEIKKTDKQYIKYGSTWFNNCCWLDDYDFTPPKNNNYQRVEVVPSWLNKEVEVNEATQEEIEELERKLDPDFEKRKEALQERLKTKYGKGVNQ